MKKRGTVKGRRLRNNRAIKRLSTTLILAVVVLGFFCVFVGNFLDSRTITGKLASVFTRDPIVLERLEGIETEELLLTPNEYSRPQTPLREVKGIVIHYTANPNTDAEANRNYFENLSVNKTTKASSHYIIGLEGQIVQCIPLNEIAYASNIRNEDTISIENCHSDTTGEFNQKTYESLVSLTASLCKAYNLDRDDILRHYDVNGKKCPLYFVENSEEWESFKDDVIEYMRKLT